MVGKYNYAYDCHSYEVLLFNLYLLYILLLILNASTWVHSIMRDTLHLLFSKNVHITGVLWTFFYKDMYIYVLFNFPFLHILRLYYLKIFTILSLLFSAFIHCSYHLFLSLLYHFTYSFSLFLCTICSLFVLRSTIFIFPLSNISLIL